MKISPAANGYLFVLLVNTRCAVWGPAALPSPMMTELVVDTVSNVNGAESLPSSHLLTMASFSYQSLCHLWQQLSHFRDVDSRNKIQ